MSVKVFAIIFFLLISMLTSDAVVLEVLFSHFRKSLKKMMALANLRIA